MSHLLLVDDDEEILSLLTSFFRKNAHGVPVATNASGMFEALEKESIDLMKHAQRVSSRDRLIDLARSSSHVTYRRSIDVQVSRPRHELEVDQKNPQLVRTVRNGGCVFAPTVTRE